MSILEIISLPFIFIGFAVLVGVFMGIVVRIVDWMSP